MDRQADVAWQLEEQTMFNRLWGYIYRASSVCLVANAVIIWSIHKYSHHPNPTIASIQLMSPLVLWEILLIMSFCPSDIIEFYLEELLIEEGHLNMEVLAHLRRGHRRRLRGVHSAGDVMNSDRTVTANTSTATNHPSATTRTLGTTASTTLASTGSFHSARTLTD